MSPHSLLRSSRILAPIVCLLFAGCASVPQPDSATVAAAAVAATTAASAASNNDSSQGDRGGSGSPSRNARPSGTPGIAAAAAAAAAAVVGQSKPFAEVIKDAVLHPGLFNVYQKDDKVWLEIAPEQFDQPFFFAANLSNGIGERMLFGGLMGESYIASFHRIGPTQIQLIARNTDFFATPGTPEARAVSEAFSDSLLATTVVVAQPNPDRKSLLVDANMLLFSDIPGANGILERTYRQSYSFDARNSSIKKVHATPDLVGINVSAHYSLQRVSQPSGGSTAYPLPATIPDVRSMFLGFYYNFAKLPDEPMRPRMADDRIGYFVNSRYDYSNDSALTPKINYIERWRLEKKDPAAELSEPKQPIVFWLDRDIPRKYRKAIIDGVLEWNKAFEKIGFKNAIRAEIQPDDADFDTLDSRHASIRWMTSARPQFGGIGPRQVDPRTGEILDADIGIDPVRLRNRRSQRVELIPQPATLPGFSRHPDQFCQLQEFAAQELGFAMDLLDVRGDMDPDGPEAEAFALADLKDVTMHEVGHALGLRHNFRASTVYSQAQLNDVEFTRANGIAGSVMEYNAVNIALPGEVQAAFGMSTLGPYDYWAISYGYSEVGAEVETAELKKIASRSNEPTLAYATDEDAAFNVDPDVNQGDLGSDPLEFARRRLLLARELWNRWQQRELKTGESYSVLRRTVERGLLVIGQSSSSIAKFVGGVTTLRDHVGSLRSPLTPASAVRQREALKIIQTGLFSADSFKFKPEFMRRLQVDYFDRSDIYDMGLTASGVDYSLGGQVLAVQRGVLGQLMSDSTAQRILDSEVKLDDPKSGFRLSELYDSLHYAIWSELKTGQDITPMRRSLQRDYISRVATALIRPAGSTPPDARALLRQDARALRDELIPAKSRSVWSKESRAHLAESATTLDEALKAPLQRQGV